MRVQDDNHNGWHIPARAACHPDFMGGTKMPNQTQTTVSSNQPPDVHADKSRYRLTKTIYAVGVNKRIGPKERILQIHGPDSVVLLKAIAQLESYLAGSYFKLSPWFLRFFSRVRRMMELINPRANEYVKAKMAENFIDELINDGYIRCLNSLAVPSGKSYLAFAQSYALRYNMPLAASLLFNPSGGARMALRYFMTAEIYHGRHRPRIITARTNNNSNENSSDDQWFSPVRTVNWPTTPGTEEPLDISEKHGKLPDGDSDLLGELWRRSPSLRAYTGTNRLSGDMPFRIVEDAVDVIFQDKAAVPAVMKAQYDRIVQTANSDGTDSFYMLYRQMSDGLKPYWDMARKMLYKYSLKLWEKRNRKRLINGQRVPAGGVTYRPKKNNCERNHCKKSVPGTIYLNNGRYYWVVRNKMKPTALVDHRNKRSLPGTIGNNKGRYFWVVPGILKQQKLVAKGQRYSTTDRAEAQRIALKLWNQIRIQKPAVAEKIMSRRPWGTAAKDKASALRIARQMWKHIRKNDPELAAKILSDNRAVSVEHWVAQISANGRIRHIGSFRNRQDATAAYAGEFERVYGYQPGYNVQSIPKLDKVWPSWQEEKARLESMKPGPVIIMPVIGRLKDDDAKPLLPLIRRMQKIDWIVKNCMLVLDDNTPYTTPDIAIESRGQKWYGEVKEQGKTPVIYGSTAVDNDSGRIRITLYGPSFGNADILAEEVYHLVYRLIGNIHPAIAERIQCWYKNKIQSGLDATLSEDEAFALSMATNGKFMGLGVLPGEVMECAGKIFSPETFISDSVMAQIKCQA